MNNQILFNELINLDDTQIKRFSFENYQTLIKIIKVIDGDTITAIFKFKDEFYKSNFRINGIDTAETHSKNNKEKEFALQTKKYLETLLLNKIVECKFLNYDKYGRILIEIYIQKNNYIESISDILIRGGYAKKYDGGKKEEWI